MKRVVLNFGNGSLQAGCSAIVATLSGLGQRQLTQCVGSLPPALDLAEAYDAWHQLYMLRSQHQGMRIRVVHSEGHRFSEAEFRDRANQLAQELNVWLNSTTFQQIDRTLRTELSRQDDIQIILETQDYQLKRLPWQQWHFNVCSFNEVHEI